MERWYSRIRSAATPDSARQRDDARTTLAAVGCPDSYLAWALGRLLRGVPSTRLLVTVPDEERAVGLARDIAFFVDPDGSGRDQGEDRVLQLPQVQTSPYAEISPDRPAIMQRMSVLWRILRATARDGEAGVALVVSAGALRRRVIPAAAFGALERTLHAGQEVERDQVVGWLRACGFARAHVVEDPGTYSVRGGIVDLYPPHQPFPARLEFFGDLVESIRLFDAASQRTLRPVDRVGVYPVRETIPTVSAAALKRNVLRAADAVRHPSSRTRLLLEELETGREFFGIEALTPAFHVELESPLWACLGGQPWSVVQVDPEGFAGQLIQEDERARRAHQARLEEGRLTFPPERFFVDAEPLQRELERGAPLRLLVNPTVERTSSAAHVEPCEVADNAELVAALRRARAERGEEILAELVARLRRWTAGDGRSVLVAGGSAARTQRLDAMLQAQGLRAEVRDSAASWLPHRAAGAVTLCQGELGAGFVDPEDGVVVLTEQEIFGPRIARRPRPRRAADGIGDLGELAQGDAVVHSEHGVGLYRGLRKLEIQGAPADYLLLEYAGGDRLYLPVYRMNLVQKFVGGDGATPRLDRLGGVTWERRKRKVKADVRKLAEELLQLYAQRAALDGHAFPPADASYAEFEATFPFTETPDQRRAVDDVVVDLMAPRPTDRLVCGDVGFGKTEVALRAAFLAAMGGKQVAVLAPTTVLVEQHHRTFSERMSPYPIRVESVSRFRPRGELTSVLRDLAAGRVDVVIGTHRLLQSDVRFRDLGLLVVDEEHRFGVAHKERLKKLRTQVDVLAMTATPIPRTLQMGMMGMRSISMIATPPVDRLSIRTFVCRFDANIVSEGIRRELDRGGQVFFVHNRVADIDEWADRVAALVPEASVAVGHGQMDARRLERVMVDFVAGKHQVLVCSTIIESGLDIPRANTMFVNRADRFGLAQLYQLRGRIGRSKHRAFCYLLVPGIESMTEPARARVEALQRFAQLGSGFSVAMRDLEIRGAGELLGRRQSGQIATVGFEAYARILEEAVAELRGEPITRETDPELNTTVPAFIPDDYVEDTGQRLELYRRLSDAASDEEAVRDILDEIRDRYGPPPPEVAALGELMVVKGLAAGIGATVVDLTESRLSLTLAETTPLRPERVIALVEAPGSVYRLTPEMRLIRTLAPSESSRPLAVATRALRELALRAN